MQKLGSQDAHISRHAATVEKKYFLSIKKFRMWSCAKILRVRCQKNAAFLKWVQVTEEHLKGKYSI